MEDSSADDSVFLTKKQLKLVTKVLRNLACYFGLYFLSIELDKWMKITDFDNINILPAFMGINAAYGTQIFLNYKKRADI